VSVAPNDSTKAPDHQVALAALLAENAEARDILAARQRVRDSFGHKARRGGCCRCVYCRRDVNGLVEHAADYEMKWFSEISRREKAEAEIQRLRRELDDVRRASQSFAKFINEMKVPSDA
jgi:hypothetical protein